MKATPRKHILAAALVCAMAFTARTSAATTPVATTQTSATEPAGDQEAELAKKLNNPISDLISVPFQANWDFNVGPSNATNFKLNFQPVIPISISEDANLIIRTILPVIDNGSPAPGIPSASGLGDTVQSFFWSPKKPTDSGWVWGVGPVLLWPTATSTNTGSGQWGAGPTFVVLKQTHGWTYGMLANQIWSYAGSDSRAPVNSLFLQPFVSYTTKTHTTIALNSESTYDWEAHQWSVPLNLSVAQLFKIGDHIMQFQLGGRYYADGPAGGPEWGMRANLTFLFPK